MEKLEEVKFAFPTDIWFYGRPYKLNRFVKKDGVKYAVYVETTLGVEQAFTERTFRYYEYYGNVERSRR